MMQMQPALFQSEIGIRLPFSRIEQCLQAFGPHKTLVNFQDFLDARAQGQEPFAHLEQACRSAGTLGPELGQAQLGKF